MADAGNHRNELMLADLDRSNSRRTGLAKKLKAATRIWPIRPTAGGGSGCAGGGRPARTVKVAEDDQRTWRVAAAADLEPVLFVCNVEELLPPRQQPVVPVSEMAKAQGAASVVIPPRSRKRDQPAGR